MVTARTNPNRQAPATRLSLEGYLAYDDGTDNRYELLNGALAEMGAENTLNTRIAVFLLLAFSQLGIPADRLGIKQKIAIGPLSAREPDLMIHSEASARAIDGATQAILRLEHPAPSVVVEIVSPGEPGEANYDRDYVEKRKEYAARQIAEYWIVDPSRQVVLVLTLVDGAYREQRFSGDDILVSGQFPGSALRAEQVLNAG